MRLLVKPLIIRLRVRPYDLGQQLKPGDPGLVAQQNAVVRIIRAAAP